MKKYDSESEDAAQDLALWQCGLKISLHFVVNLKTVTTLSYVHIKHRVSPTVTVSMHHLFSLVPSLYSPAFFRTLLIDIFFKFKHPHLHLSVLSCSYMFHLATAYGCLGNVARPRSVEGALALSPQKKKAFTLTYKCQHSTG